MHSLCDSTQPWQQLVQAPVVRSQSLHREDTSRQDTPDFIYRSVHYWQCLVAGSNFLHPILLLVVGAEEVQFLSFTSQPSQQVKQDPSRLLYVLQRLFILLQFPVFMATQKPLKQTEHLELLIESRIRQFSILIFPEMLGVGAAIAGLAREVSREHMLPIKQQPSQQDRQQPNYLQQSLHNGSTSLQVILFTRQYRFAQDWHTQFVCTAQF